jgi:late competence protein required for DNA uptake (superfamily II DNA/RNA helicase)
MTERTYRCLNCREYTLTRPFDVSHLSITCPTCGDFQRFANENVLVKFRDFEEDPPEHLEWERLDRSEKLMISERIVRQGHSIEDFDLEAEDPGDDDADGGADTDHDSDAVADADSDPDADSPPDSAE